MLEFLKALGILGISMLIVLGYIFFLNFLMEAPKCLAQIAKSLEIICERMNSDGPRK